MMDIKAIRKRLGLSQVKFAKGIGMCKFSVVRWESGECKPSPLARRAIREVYGIKEVKNDSVNRQDG